MKASVVVPAYNEGRNIESVLRGIRRTGNYEIIVVDDGSLDDTSRIAKKYAKVIRLSKNRGKGYACRVGAGAANYKHLVFIDSDGQLSPKYIPILLKELKTSGLVLGNRNWSSVPMKRRISNGFARFLIRVITKADVDDCLCGLRAIRKKDFLSLRLEKDRYEFESEMLIKAAKHGLRIKSVPVGVTYSSGGMSLSQSLKVAFYLLSNLA